MARESERAYGDFWDHSYRSHYDRGSEFRRPQDAATESLKEFLRWEVMPRAGARVLDAGCGDGLNAVFLASLGYEVTGIDVSATALSRAQKYAQEKGLKVLFCRGDVRAMHCFADGSFAAAIDNKTFHSLWTFADRSEYLGELHRVLHPGGVLFFRQNCTSAELRDEFGWREFLGKPITGNAEDADTDRVARGVWPNSITKYQELLGEVGFTVAKAEFHKGDPDHVSVIWAVKE